MRYVQRDRAGLVIGHYACEQDYARESLPDNHADIEAYKARVQALIDPPADVRIAGTVRRSAYARGLTKVLADRFGMTVEELLAEITASAGPDADG